MIDNKYLEASIQIGNQVSSVIEQRFSDLEPDFNIRSNEKLNIYSGYAGIALFLSTLQQVYPTNRYLVCLDKLYVFLQLNIHHEQYSTFLFGRLGISYVLAKLGKILNRPVDKKIIQTVLTTVREDLEHVERKNFDLLHGIAGILQGLLMLPEQAVFESEVEFLADLCLEKLIQGVKYNASGGIFWNSEIRYNRQVKAICGVAHGGSGIGTVLITAGKFSNNSFLAGVGLAAFRHEDTFFNEHVNNWPDFERTLYSKEELTDLISNMEIKDFALFQDDTFMERVAWCNGAPGIILSRLELFGQVQEEAHKIPDTIVSVLHHLSGLVNSTKIIKKDYTICHGLGGIGITFLSYYYKTGDTYFFDEAKKLANQSIELLKEAGAVYPGEENHITNPFFFNGISGLGYYYLLAGDFMKENIFFDLQLQRGLPFVNQHYFLTHFSKWHFPRSLFYYTCLIDENFAFDDFRGEVFSANQVLRYVLKKLKVLTSDIREVLMDCIRLEYRLFNLICSVKDHRFHAAIRNYAADITDSALRAIDDGCLDKIYAVNPFDEIIYTRFKWDMNEKFIPNDQRSDQPFPVLLRPGIQAKFITLSNFTNAIRIFFVEPHHVSACLAYFRKVYAPVDHQEEEFKQLIITQVKELIKSQIIISK